MTAGHADRRCQFGKDIERSHHRDGGGKALQISAEAVGLDFLSGDHDKYHHSPGGFCGKISGGASKADEADQVGEYAGGKKRGHKRYEIAESLAHISDDKLVGLLYDELGQSLSLGYVLFLQITGEPDARASDEKHDKPADHHGFADLKLP